MERLQPQELPRELPRELIEKFQVQDVQMPAVPPSTRPLVPTPPVTLAAAAPDDGSDEDKDEDEEDDDDEDREAKVAVPPAPAAPLKTPPKAVVPAPAPRRTGPFKYRTVKMASEPIWVGEEQTYDITFFGMVAGTFRIEAMPLKFINSRRVYHVRGHAKSSKVFSLFYSLDDMVETFIDFDGMFSHRFHLVLEETKQARDSLELFDTEKLETFYWDRLKHKEKGYRETKVFKKIKVPFSQDSLSSLYFLRTVELPPGGIVKVPVVSQGKNWEAEVHVIRRETLNTPVGELKTVVVKPLTKYKGVLKQKGDSFLWLTDDGRHTLVRMEAKVKIGGVVAELVSWKKGERPAVTKAAGGP